MTITDPINKIVVVIKAPITEYLLYPKMYKLSLFLKIKTN